MSAIRWTEDDKAVLAALRSMMERTPGEPGQPSTTRVVRWAIRLALWYLSREKKGA